MSGLLESSAVKTEIPVRHPFIIINEGGNPPETGYYDVLTTNGLFPNYMNTFDRWWDAELNRWCESGLDKNPARLTIIGWKPPFYDEDDYE